MSEEGVGFYQSHLDAVAGNHRAFLFPDFPTVQHKAGFKPSHLQVST